jgi:hypothetical protein
MRSADTRVLRATVDGRAVETGRYRGGVRFWRLDYHAPPDSGFALGLALPAGSALSLDLSARARGVPQLPNVTLPARPANVVTVHSGDVTLIHRTFRVQ